VLTEALGLWHGSALADVPPSALVGAEARRLEEARLTARKLRAEADLGCGLHAQLVPELRRLVGDQPLREELWGLLIRALDGAGRHAEAVASYGQAREVIADELGVDPGAELQRLYQNLLAADAVPQRRPPAGGAGPGAAGYRAAADPAAWWAADPADQRGAAGLPGSPSVPAQLPADLADFTGRGRLVEQLRGLLTQTQQPENAAAVAVTVVAGAGGLGKTALALHAAHALRPAFLDGQLYVSLLGASQQPIPPDEVLARLLRDLGVPGTRIPVGQEERAALYRTCLAGRQMLILLDDAKDAAQVGRCCRGRRRPP
jgi:hypothetical protein